MKKRKMNLLWLVLAIVIFLCSAWNLLEGGPQISTVKRDQLDTVIAKIDGAVRPPIAVGERDEVLVALCKDREEGVYILEFSKNTLFDRYALREAHRWYGREPFATIVSSALRNYPYEVDVEAGTVTVYDGTLRNTVWNDGITLILSLLVMVLYPLERKKQ